MLRIGFYVLFLLFLHLNPENLYAQKSEIGICFTFSGHLIFGPYYRYWFDDHNEVDICLPAAWEGRGKVIFPSGFQTGYHYYFGDSHWRPSVGLQYHLYFGPKENEKRKNIQLLSLVPGIQYRWNESKASVEEFVWISTMNVKGKQKIMPTGLETKFGIRF